LLSLVLLAAAGCTSVARGPAPIISGVRLRPGGLPPGVRTFGLDETRLAARAAELVPRLKAASSDGTIDILALSGGGAGGAFGAGALVGWTKHGDRPQFDVVTGVSAGAFIAPFAFLGPQWDAQLTAALAGAGTSHMLQRRSLDILFRASVYRGKPLTDFVATAFPDSLIDAVARESASGRMLLVATTDLDTQTPHRARSFGTSSWRRRASRASSLPF
jgi:predicted acylesterase/phospholipase RssA